MLSTAFVERPPDGPSMWALSESAPFSRVNRDYGTLHPKPGLGFIGFPYSSSARARGLNVASRSIGGL